MFNAIDLKKFEKFSMICYLGMGWMIVLCAKMTYQALGLGGCVFLLAGRHNVYRRCSAVSRRNKKTVYTFCFSSFCGCRQHTSYVYDPVLCCINTFYSDRRKVII